MKKFTFFLIAAMICSLSFGQRTSTQALSNFKLKGSLNANKAEQLVMNWEPILPQNPSDPTNVTFYSCGNASGSGYVCGHNQYKDKAKAEKFVFTNSGTINAIAFLPYVDGTSQNLTIKIYNDNSGLPGTALCTETVPFAELESYNINIIDLTNPLAFTAGTYYVSFEYAYTSPIDTFALFQQDPDYATINTAYEKWSDNSWISMEESWGEAPGDFIFNLFVGLYLEFDTNVDLTTYFVTSLGSSTQITTLELPYDDDLELYPVLKNQGNAAATADVSIDAKINGVVLADGSTTIVPMNVLVGAGGLAGGATFEIRSNVYGAPFCSISSADLLDVYGIGSTVTAFDVIFKITYTGTDVNTANDQATLHVTRPIGINTATTESFKIYPNPAKGSANIYATENSDVNIYDVTGKMISNFKMKAGETKSFSQAAGMYFVNVNGCTQKVVIE